MKKRFVALLLCLVMLVTCMGVGLDVISGDEDAAAPAATVEPTAEPSAEPASEPSAEPSAEPAPDSDLYAQLMACKTQAEMNAIVEEFGEEQITAQLTEEQLAQLEEHYAGLESNSGSGDSDSNEVVYPAPSFTKAGPIIDYNYNNISGDIASSANTSRQKLLKSRALSTNNTPSQKEENGIILNKSSKLVSDSTAENPIYEIDLTAEAKSVIVNNSKACDIVLVLDRSGSMKGANVSSLITAVNNFLATVQEKSPDSRVAIVTYADPDTKDGVASIDSGGKTAATAFVPVTSISADGVKTVNSALTSVVNGLANRCDGGTQSSKGLEKAVDIFQAVPDKVNGKDNEAYNNSRVTILFTDGVPGNSGWGRFDGLQGKAVCGYRVAQESIHWSTILKADKGSSVSLNMNSAFYEDYSKPEASIFQGKTTGCGATVYCVGLNLDSYKSAGDNGAKINEYMYRVSSHRKTGTHVTTSTYENEWEKAQTDWSKKYKDDLTRNRPEGSYYAVGDNSALNNIFTTIASQTGSSVENVSVRDYISTYFDICDSTGKKYSVGDEIVSGNRTGVIKQDNNGIYVEWSNVTLTPPEVDKNGNVTTPATKFESQIFVTPKAEFLGGNGVPTNGSDSGIYDGDHTLAKFPEPTVDVAIKANVSAVDYNVYLYGSVPTVDQLYKINGITNPLTWQDDFVTITKSLDKSVSNTKDDSYNITVKVEPKNDGTAKAVTKTAPAKVNVFVPELTYQDSAIDLGQTPDYAKENLVSEKWKHDSTYSTEVTMTGTAPGLDLSYDPEASAFEKDTPVSVTVKINGENVTDKVTFLHKDCDYNGCDFKAGNCHFIVHIKTFDLTITKNITSDESNLYGERNFVFTITAQDGTKIQAVVNVKAGEKTGSTTIKGLPVGTYKIEEDTIWSWRYDLKGVAAATDVKGTLDYTSGNAFAMYTPSDGTHNEVVFTNSLTNYHWLSFVDSVRNFFNAK